MAGLVSMSASVVSRVVDIPEVVGGKFKVVTFYQNLHSTTRLKKYHQYFESHSATTGLALKENKLNSLQLVHNNRIIDGPKRAVLLDPASHAEEGRINTLLIFKRQLKYRESKTRPIVVSRRSKKYTTITPKKKSKTMSVNILNLYQTFIKQKLTNIFSILRRLPKAENNWALLLQSQLPCG